MQSQHFASIACCCLRRTPFQCLTRLVLPAENGVSFRYFSLSIMLLVSPPSFQGGRYTPPGRNQRSFPQTLYNGRGSAALGPGPGGRGDDKCGGWPICSPFYRPRGG